MAGAPSVKPGSKPTKKAAPAAKKAAATPRKAAAPAAKKAGAAKAAPAKKTAAAKAAPAKKAAPAPKKAAPAKKTAPPTKKAEAATTKKAVAPPRKADATHAPKKSESTKAADARSAPDRRASEDGKKAAEVKAKPSPPKKKTVICSLSGFEVTPSPPALAPKTVTRLREKLIEEKQRLLHQADELAAEAEELAREREAGDTQFDEESGEGDTVNIERERDLLLSASARQVVEDIDAALARMKKGTYGVCSYAGRKIPLERLEAIPWADVCVDCKARAERRR
jgi:RNA polymerase-binding protein DksA